MLNIFFKGGVGKDLFVVVYVWVGYWFGGLVVVIIVFCVIFVVIFGFFVVIVVIIGIVVILEMISCGYEKKFVYGFFVVGGMFGILIFFFILMIVYGFVIE